MNRVKWELEEAVALFDLYLKNGASLSVPEEKLLEISKAYRKRAEQMKLPIDEKFRNLNGLKMQIGCIHFVVTGGQSGLSGASHLFYRTYDLYKEDPIEFQKLADDFYEKYYK